MNVPRLPPLSLYVHLPWCVRKCPYCDFNSYSGGADAPRDRYIDALRADLAAAEQFADGRELASIFLGGGTPSLFSADEVATILAAAAANFDFAPDAEITMEANPGTVECGNLAGYREAGVNRLSVGAQTFDAGKLTALGRIHSVEDISRTIVEARDAGFDDINVDLMYALPGQDVRAAMADIDEAAELRPTHISWYHLTLEPNTVFHSRPPADLPGEDQSAAIQEAGETRLAELGYERYEVSAFAKNGHRCRHNLNYWSFGDYIGVGAGAHGKVTTARDIYRTTRPANPQQYMKSMTGHDDGPTRKQLSESDLLFEFMLNVLRLTEGFDEQLFTDRTRLPAGMLRQRLTSLRDRGLLDEAGANRWQATPIGRRFLNDLQAHFLPE